MLTEIELDARSGNKCELCKGVTNLSSFEVTNSPANFHESNIYACEICRNQFENPKSIDINHWRLLNDSIWSDISAIKVLSYRILLLIKNEGWPQDLLEMMYLEEVELNWAKASSKNDDAKTVHLDSNGIELRSGDTVILTKTLDVKGSSISAKRGTAVRNISLVHDNYEQIEGRIDGQQIVILTKYVKRR